MDKLNKKETNKVNGGFSSELVTCEVCGRPFNPNTEKDIGYQWDFVGGGLCGGAAQKEESKERICIFCKGQLNANN